MKNIQKITKAMKMVAASKLRAIQVRAENSRGLWQPFTALLGDTPSMFSNNTSGSIFQLHFYGFICLLFVKRIFSFVCELTSLVSDFFGLSTFEVNNWVVHI